MVHIKNTNFVCILVVGVIILLFVALANVDYVFSLVFRAPFFIAMMRRPPMPGHGPLPVPPPPVPLPGKISNVTNSNDPSSKESRVFVGNLNTIVIKKEDVDAIFHRYGIVTGISMHKGYAFVQFNHPAEARRAVSFENGQVYAGQPLG